MLIKELELKKPDGLLNKDATILVSRAMRYNSDILLEQGSKKINAKSLMGVISMGLKKGNKIMIIIKGDDQEEALNDIESLFARNFQI